MKEIYLYVMILFRAMLSAEFLYLKYMRGFFSYRAIETKDKFFGDEVINNLTVSMNTVLVILKDYYFSIPVIIVIVALILYLYFSKSKFSLPVFMSFIFAVSIVYTIIVTYLAPVKTLRYAMPVFPFLIIFPLLLLQSIKNKKIFLFSSIVLCISFSLNAFNFNKIEYLFKDKPKQYLFTQNPEIPVFIINKSFWWYTDLVPYFNDNQTYIFSDKFDFNTEQYDQFYIVVEKGLVPEINSQIPRSHITETFDLEFFTGMKMCYSCSLKD
jgi:hypothetical protein